MLQKGLSSLVFLTILGHVLAGPSLQERAAPTVRLDSATVTGATEGSTSKFLGIPYAQPPIGNLRLQLPQALPPYDTSFSATEFGPPCPQQAIPLPGTTGLPPNVQKALDYLGSQVYGPSSESCLTINVFTPADVTPTSKLPVVVWFIGRGYEVAGSSVYDGSKIVERAVSLDVPSIFVSMNYRINGLGFLASKEVKEAGIGNLGLRDQRLALQWVQKYIGAFGGDPTKVAMWGTSAGAMSIIAQMLTNGGDSEGLFRAAFMQSGGPLPVGDITHGQQYYDAIVEQTGCSGAEDTLQCLRGLPLNTYMDAVNNMPGIFAYQSLAVPWLPRVDGDFITADPLELVQQGAIANIPIVSGNVDDEGTWFSLTTLNITTDAQLAEYVQTYWAPGAPDDMIAKLLTYYPSDPAQGSPFDTGDSNQLSPQYKRIAALLGDAVFQAPRRFLLQSVSERQNAWTYVSKRLKSVPYLGAGHGTDNVFNPTGDWDMASYAVRFIANLDPNVGKSDNIYWPQYHSTGNKAMLEFSDGLETLTLTTDTYRADAMAYLTDVSLAYPL